MSLKQSLGFAFAAVTYLFALAMFFWFPGVEAWTFSALGPLSLSPSAWICGLLVLLVILPSIFGPVALAARAKASTRPVLATGSVVLGGLFLTAGLTPVLLYGRVALIGLLSGQLLALGLRVRDSVGFNWAVYLAFVLANMNYPDPAILAGANLLAGAYLLFAGASLLTGRWEIPTEDKKRGYRVMVG